MSVGEHNGKAAKAGHDMAKEKVPKFKVGDIVVGKTIGGWGFGKARVTKIMGYSVADDNETYEAELLESSGRIPAGIKITVKNFDCELYRSAGLMRPSLDAKANVRDIVQPAKIETFVQGSTVNGVLTAIRANGKVWDIKALSEAVIRKMMPVGTVAKKYFPLARRAEAAVSWLGNEKHNPGEELNWARDKSNDHLDCAGRHLTESDDWDVTVLPDGRAYAVLHAAQLAWRASALAELAAEKYSGVVIVQLEVPCGGENAQKARTAAF